MGGSSLSRPLSEILELEKEFEPYSDAEIKQVIQELENTNLRDYVELVDQIDEQAVLDEQLKALREFEARKETPIHEWGYSSSVSVDRVLKSQIGKVALNDMNRNLVARRAKILRLMKTLVKKAEKKTTTPETPVTGSEPEPTLEVTGDSELCQLLRELQSLSQPKGTGFKDIKAIKEVTKTLKQLSTLKDLSQSLESVPDLQNKAASILSEVVSKMESSDGNLMTPKLVGDCLAQLVPLSVLLQNLPLLTECTALALSSRLHRSLPAHSTTPKAGTPSLPSIQIEPPSEHSPPTRIDLSRLETEYKFNLGDWWKDDDKACYETLRKNLHLTITDRFIVITNSSLITNTAFFYPRNPIKDHFDDSIKNLDPLFDDEDDQQPVPIEIIQPEKHGSDALWHPLIYQQSNPNYKRIFALENQPGFVNYMDDTISFGIMGIRTQSNPISSVKLDHCKVRIPSDWEMVDVYSYSLDKGKSMQALVIAVHTVQEEGETPEQPKVTTTVKAFLHGNKMTNSVEIPDLPIGKESGDFSIIGTIEGMILCSSSLFPTKTLVYDSEWKKIFELEVRISGIDPNSEEVCFLDFEKKTLRWAKFKNCLVHDVFDTIVSRPKSSQITKSEDGNLKTAGFVKVEPFKSDIEHILSKLSSTHSPAKDSLEPKVEEDEDMFLLSSSEHETYRTLQSLSTVLGNLLRSHIHQLNTSKRVQLVNRFITILRCLEKLENKAVGYSIIYKLLQCLILTINTDKSFLHEVKSLWKPLQEVLTLLASTSNLRRVPMSLQLLVGKRADQLNHMISVETGDTTNWSGLVEKSTEGTTEQIIMGFVGLLSKGTLEKWVDEEFFDRLEECLSLEIQIARQSGDEHRQFDETKLYMTYNAVRKRTYIQLDVILALTDKETSPLLKLDEPDLSVLKKEKIERIINLLTEFFTKLIKGGSSAKDSLDNDSSTGVFTKKLDILFSNFLVWRLMVQLIVEKPLTKHEGLEALLNEMGYWATKVGFAFDDILSIRYDSSGPISRPVIWRKTLQRSIGTIALRVQIPKSCFVRLETKGVQATDSVKTFLVFFKSGDQSVPESIVQVPYLIDSDSSRYYPHYAKEILIVFSMDPSLIDSENKNIKFELTSQSDGVYNDQVEEVHENVPENQDPPQPAKLLKRIVRKPTQHVLKPSQFPIGGVIFAGLNYIIERFRINPTASETLKILNPFFERNTCNSDDPFKYYYSAYLGVVGEVMEIAQLTKQSFKDVEITDSQIKKIKDYLAYAAEDGNYYRNSQNTGEILAMGEMDHFCFNIENSLAEKVGFYNQREDRFWDRRVAYLADDHMYSHYLSEMDSLLPNQPLGLERTRLACELDLSKTLRRLWNDLVLKLDNQITKIRDQITPEDFEQICISAMYNEDVITPWLTRNYTVLCEKPETLETLLEQDPAVACLFPNGTNSATSLSQRQSLITSICLMRRTLTILSANSEIVANKVNSADFKQLGFVGVMVLSEIANQFYSQLRPFFT